MDDIYYLIFLKNDSNFMLSDIYTAYYRGAMGILLVYDVTDESSFDSISLFLFLSYFALNDTCETY